MAAFGALFLLTVTGALLAPIPVLTLTDGRSQVVVSLSDGEPYVYSYVNSIYDAPVEERHLRVHDHLSITEVRSPDIRAVEYFRWDGRIRAAGGAYEQAAPPNQAGRLAIRVTPAYQQRLAGAGWTVDLAGTFGDGVVQVSPERLPILVALLRGWRP